MKRRTAAVALVAPLAAACAGLERLSGTEAGALMERLAIWAWPLLVMERTRLLSLYRPTAGAPPSSPNVLRHAQRLATHRNRNVVMPNNDTLYSSAWLSLQGRALRLELPSAGERYRSFQLLDAHTETAAVVHEGNTLIAGPGWSGPVPGDVRLVRSTTDLNWLLGRTQVYSAEDVLAAAAVQRVATLYPWSGATVPAPETAPALFKPPQDPVSEGVGMLDEIAALLPRNQPSAAHAWVGAAWARLGFLGAASPSQRIASQGWQVAAETALQRAAARVRARGRESLSATPGAQVDRGWRHDDVGRYGNDDLLRAATAWRGLGALPPSEAVYLTTSRDAAGQALRGSRPVTLSLDRRRWPSIGAFWSLSLYDASEFFFVDNPIGRYAISEATPGLLRDADGSIPLTVSAEAPVGARRNWLPAPADDYVLVMRLYRPTAAAGAYLAAMPRLMSAPQPG
jgi:hypothetical protein